MPLGRVILTASEARASRQASRNSAINIAICLIRDQLQSDRPSHLLSGQSLTGAGRRSELSLLLRYSEQYFLKKVWTRILHYVLWSGGCCKGGFRAKGDFMQNELSGSGVKQGIDDAKRAIGLAAAMRRGAGRGPATPLGSIWRGSLQPRGSGSVPGRCHASVSLHWSIRK